MDQPTIDRATYDELKQTAGDDFVGELVETFLVDAPRLLDDLRHAYEKRDADAFRRTAHSLKSNGNTFGARNFAAMAKDLELGGLNPVVQAGGAPVDALAAEFRQVAAALKELGNA
jgi:HPt (histidine-containing phosphotransfer) domain-containing protein